MEDWIDSPVSSSVPVPVVRARKTKKRRHRPAPVPFVNIVEVPASSVITVNAVVLAGSVPASVDGEVKVMPGIGAPAFISNAHSIDSPRLQALSVAWPSFRLCRSQFAVLAVF